MPDVFDTHADTYSEHIDEVLGKYGADHDLFTQHKAWLIGELLRAQGRDMATSSLLDVGCGVGKIHRYLEGKLARIVGVDVSTASLEVARETYKSIEYEAYEGDRLPFDDDAFDLSLAICVFHHVPPGQWAQLAREMVRVLKPGGMSLVIEHNPCNPVTRRIVNTCDLDKDAILLWPSKLKSFFESAGAEEVRSRSIVSLPPVTHLLRRLDHALGILPFGAQYYVVCRKPSQQPDASAKPD